MKIIRSNNSSHPNLSKIFNTRFTFYFLTHIIDFVNVICFYRPRLFIALCINITFLLWGQVLFMIMLWKVHSDLDISQFLTFLIYITNTFMIIFPASNIYFVGVLFQGTFPHKAYMPNISWAFHLKMYFCCLHIQKAAWQDITFLDHNLFLSKLLSSSALRVTLKKFDTKPNSYLLIACFFSYDFLIEKLAKFPSV